MGIFLLLSPAEESHISPHITSGKANPYQSSQNVLHRWLAAFVKHLANAVNCLTHGLTAYPQSARFHSLELSLCGHIWPLGHIWPQRRGVPLGSPSIKKV